jgi:hypothetical protein
LMKEIWPGDYVKQLCQMNNFSCSFWWRQPEVVAQGQDIFTKE